jgi:N-acetyl-beta-hexosaminidase
MVEGGKIPRTYQQPFPMPLSFKYSNQTISLTSLCDLKLNLMTDGLHFILKFSHLSTCTTTSSALEVKITATNDSFFYA